jgi:hypothetical protein
MEDCLFQVPGSPWRSCFFNLMQVSNAAEQFLKSVWTFTSELNSLLDFASYVAPVYWHHGVQVLLFSMSVGDE